MQNSSKLKKLYHIFIQFQSLVSKKTEDILAEWLVHFVTMVTNKERYQSAMKTAFHLLSQDIYDTK